MTVKQNLSIDDNVKKVLNDEAKKAGMTVSAFVTMLLLQEVRKIEGISSFITDKRNKQ